MGHCTVGAQLGPQLGVTELSAALFPYLATEGLSLSPDHIAHQVTEVHPVWKLIWPKVVKLWVLVQLCLRIFIWCFLKQKKQNMKMGSITLIV